MNQEEYTKAPHPYINADMVPREPFSRTSYCQAPQCGQAIRSEKKGADGVMICLECFHKFIQKEGL